MLPDQSNALEQVSVKANELCQMIDSVGEDWNLDVAKRLVVEAKLMVHIYMLHVQGARDMRLAAHSPGEKRAHLRSVK